MRIVGGTWRGRPLAAVGKGDPAAHLRPTSDRVRESLFNLLAHSHGDPVPGAQILDLFAGTGALGLEALSRGAKHATLIDRGPAALRLLSENIGRLGAADRATVLKRDATRTLPPAPIPATLIFLDPPYGKDLGSKALAQARAAGWIAPGALVVWEESAPQSPPECLEHADRREYGDTHVTILRDVVS